MGVIVDSNELAQYFNIYDSNRSGTLDYKEFSDIVFNKGQFQASGGSPSKS
jgi:Ca2+-binding EF-hand superfamily protein